MSGLLRRIKRSRAADAGEAPAEGRAAGPEGAPTTAETSGGDASSAETAGSATGEHAFGGADTAETQASRPSATDASSAETTELPAAAPADEAAGPDSAQAASPKRRRIGGRFRGLRRRRASTEPPAAATATQATAPAIRADPNTPAGLDPAAAGVAPPSGRRGRLRRRLRYLRRARELMLRDLGGLLYEVHRTAGGDVAAHSTVIGAKVERLSRLDAESEVIETALGAPRSEAVVFQPGVGGACKACGELYGSAARFCSHCGSPTGSAARMTPALVEPRTLPEMPKAPGEQVTPRASDAGTPAATAATAAPADTGAVRGGEKETPGDQVGGERGETVGSSDEALAQGIAKEAPGEDKTPGGQIESQRGADATSSDRIESQRGEDETHGDRIEAQRGADATSGDRIESQGGADATSGDEPGAPGDETAAEAPAGEPATEHPPATGEPGGEPGNRSSRLSNGRSEDRTPPELSSGDPLSSRERP